MYNVLLYKKPTQFNILQQKEAFGLFGISRDNDKKNEKRMTMYFKLVLGERVFNIPLIDAFSNEKVT